MILEGALHLAPIKNPQRILDIGTGTGKNAVSCITQHETERLQGSGLFLLQSKDQCLLFMDSVLITTLCKVNILLQKSSDLT